MTVPAGPHIEPAVISVPRPDPVIVDAMYVPEPACGTPRIADRVRDRPSEGVTAGASAMAGISAEREFAARRPRDDLLLRTVEQGG